MERFKNREWLMTGIILILFQFIIQSAAWLYGDSKSALNYISFAGTIVSIILAVLAIIYSYIQNISQQNSATTISSQVDKLISVADTINSSKKELSKSLSHLKKVSVKLDYSLSSQYQIKSSIEDLNRKLRFNSEETSDTIEKYASSIQDNDEIWEKPYTSGSNGTVLNSLFIYYGEKYTLTFDELKEQLLPAFFEGTIKDFSRENSESLNFLNTYKQVITQVGQILHAFGLITIEESHDYYSIHQKFRESSEKFIDFIKTEQPDKVIFRAIETLENITLEQE